MAGVHFVQFRQDESGAFPRGNGAGIENRHRLASPGLPPVWHRSEAVGDDADARDARISAWSAGLPRFGNPPASPEELPRLVQALGALGGQERALIP